MLGEEDRAAFARSSLRSVDAAVIERLAAHGVHVDLPPGGTSHRAGDGPTFGLVVRGLLRLFMESPSGRQVTLRYARAGALLGVATAFSDVPVYLSQEALVATRMLVMPPATLRQLAGSDVALARALLCETSDRVQTYIAIAGGDVLSTTRQRVIAHLLQIARFSPGSTSGLVARIEQQQLADAAGTVREVVVRILRDLREAGLVHTARDGIDLLDPERLEAELWPAGILR